jgi:hypothetical protein
MGIPRNGSPQGWRATSVRDGLSGGTTGISYGDIPGIRECGIRLGDMKRGFSVSTISGVVIGILIAAVGAILYFAVTVSPYQHGFDVNTIGLILMVVGIVGIVLSLVFGIASQAQYRGLDGGYRRHRTVVDDGQGHVSRREDSYL